MAAHYASFQIRNATAVPMVISVNDPDGNVHNVGVLDPGKTSIQVAPGSITWSTKPASLTGQETIETPAKVKPAIISEPATVEKISRSVESGPSTTVASITRSALQDQDTEPTEYEVFLKLETGTHTARINQLLVTPDSKALITAGSDKTIRVWDIETREQVRPLLGQIGAGDNGNIKRMALSRDGKYVIALAWLNLEGTHGALDRETDVRVYELATGNLQARFRYPGTLQDLDFSPEDRYIAMVGHPKQPDRRGYVQVYDVSALLQGFGVAPPPLASAPLYDYEALIPAYVRFVPDNPAKSSGYRIVVATWYAHKFQNPEYTGGLQWYSFSPPAGLKKTLSCSVGNREEGVPPESLAVSSEFVIVTTHWDFKEFYCHNHDGKLVATVPSDSVPAAPAFSQDESQLIVGQRGDSPLVQVKVYDTALGGFQLKSTYYNHDGEVVAAALLQDGTAVSAGGDQNAIHFWDPTLLKGKQTAEIKGVGRVVHAVGLNPDEQIGIGNHDDLRLDDSIVLRRVFDLQGMNLKSLSVEESATFRRAQQRAGAQWLEWSNVNLWLRTDDRISYAQPLTGTPDPHQPGSFLWYGPTTFGFTEKGTIVTGAGDGKVRVAPQDAHGFYRYLPWRFLLGHTAALRDHAALGRWLVTAGADQIIRLWYLEDVEQDSMEDLQPSLNLFVGSDDEWVIWSKSGYYNASQRGDRHIGYHVNRGADKEALFFPSDRFKAFLRPDIIKAIVEHGSEDRAREGGVAIPKIDVSQNLPPIVELIEKGVSVTEADLTFIFTVKALNRDKPVTRVWIVQNERFACEGDGQQDQYAQYTVQLPLLPGLNSIKIIAENESAKSNPIELRFWRGTAQPDQVAASPEAGRGGVSDLARSALDISLANVGGLNTGTLYILAVGVSTLKLPRPDRRANHLKYAHTDATAIHNAFASTRAFQAVDPKLLVNGEATKDRINTELNRICETIKKNNQLSPTNRDVLLVYLAGHGVYLNIADTGDQDLYFWNYELDFDHTGATGFSFIELGKKITSLPAEVILMTDACHSGMAGSDVVKGIDPNELAKRIYAINERGMYIFNAARTFQSAFESDTVEHGYFTKSILDVLSGRDAVTMLELMSSVQLRVQFYSLKDNIVRQTPVFRTYGDLLPLVVYKK